MEKKIKKLENDMINVSDNILAILQQDIAEIKSALLGNEYNPSGGLLNRTTYLEKELDKLKMRYDRMLWTVGGGAAIIAVIFNLIMAFFDKLIIK